MLGTLGYRSDRTVSLPDSSPQAFRDFIAGSPQGGAFNADKALFSDWTTADLLFQLTDDDLASTASLFHETGINPGLLQSYVFFAIELDGSSAVNGAYARGRLTAIARQLNRVFPMPVMVLIKHPSPDGEVLSVAVINRRRNKVRADKDVLEKATIIRDISLTQPHRGHKDILASFAIQNLVHPKKLPITNFDALHTAWEQIFNIELLNKRFYKELANWYFWALPQVEFPADLEPDDEKRRATGLIRLLTRLIFCWFLKEKGLIPENLFHPTDLSKILKGFDPESETSSTYYQAILQNLFFATLNQRMGKDGNGKPYRFFATDEGFAKNRATYDINNLFRYEKLFAVPQDEALALFADIPFLNGGLFECLDRTEDGTDKKRYLDGFSRRKEKRPHVPDRLFFDSGETADLSKVYGDKKRKSERVTGLITILNRYKFTIVENTPIDQEIALDPELLGKVFENLLASYNEETKTTARKQTGSFYTPRPIVDYMVDESLKAHLTRALVEKARMKEPDARAGLDLLFAYTEKEHAFTPAEVATLIAAIDEVKILDPACGSGAFPMGVLHKLVYILGKLDPDNDRWKQTQLAKLDSAPMREELERAFADNNDDYGRKLYLIENCLYGVDIQPIAIQITKLRFFISLVCDQKTSQNKAKNLNIKPLPNLETKFVAANSLIGLPEMTQSLLVDPRVGVIEKEIESLYHNHFSVQRRDQKFALQKKIKGLRQDLARLLSESLMAPKKALHIAEWDPFDPQTIADFFDPHWMFGRCLANGFDIVIANPPYVGHKGGQKALFTEMKSNSLGTRFNNERMDLFYYFFHLAIDSVCQNGIIAFITTNYYVTADSAIKLRKDFQKRTTALALTNFNEVKIFESAVGQHNMITILRKEQDRNTNCRISVTRRDGFAPPELLRQILDGNDDQTFYRNIPQQELYEGNLLYISAVNVGAKNSASVEAVLEKLAAQKSRVGDVCNIGQGIVTGMDRVSPKHLRKLTAANLDLGKGCFVISESERHQLTDPNDPILKPWFKNSDIKRYVTECKSPSWLIHATVDIDREHHKGVFDHLDSLRVAIEARNYDSGELSKASKQGAWWTLSSARKDFDFSTPKIVSPQRSYTNTFGYNEVPWYASADVYFITQKCSTVSLKYVLALLNSKIYFVWLYFKGKRKGEMLELYQKPLSEIPIKIISGTEQKPFIELVNRILAAKEANPAADTSALEREIDQQVYALYGLTPEEVDIVEGTAQ